MGCKSLTSQSSSILLSQKLHEDGGTYFTLPGSRIPEWFDHCCKGSSLSFWFRKNFPSIALCFVHLLTRSTPSVRVRVNSHEMDFQLLGRYSNLINKGGEYVSLFDLDKTIQSSRADDVAEKEYKKDGWNHVEVKYIGYGVNWIGVHVYKQETNTEDVRFTDPSIQAKKRKRVPPRRTSDIGDGLLEVCETQDARKQQNFAGSISNEMSLPAFVLMDLSTYKSGSNGPGSSSH